MCGSVCHSLGGSGWGIVSSSTAGLCRKILSLKQPLKTNWWGKQAYRSCIVFSGSDPLSLQLLVLTDSFHLMPAAWALMKTRIIVFSQTYLLTFSPWHLFIDHAKGSPSRSTAVTIGCITHLHKHQKLLRIQCKNRAWEVCSYDLGVLTVDPFPCPLLNLRLWLTLDPSLAFKSQFKDS